MKDLKINIDEKFHTFNIPETFAELSQEQYLRVVKLLYSKSYSKDHYSLKLDALLGLLGFYEKKKKRIKNRELKVFETLVLENRIADLFHLLDPFHTLDFIEWKVECLTFGKKSFHGPDNAFASVTFGEFIAADMLVTAYFSSNDKTLLDKLIAILFREKLNGKRVELQEYEHREVIVQQLEENTKTAILYNYLAVRNYLTETYSLVFSDSKISRRTNIKLGKQENSWLSVRRHLAGSVLNLEKVDKLNLHEVLSSLNEEIRDKD